MDNQRLILLLVFIFSLFMLWDGWQRQIQPAAVATTAQSVQQTAPLVQGAAPTPSTPLSAASTPPSSVPAPEQATISEVGTKTLVKTDLYLAEISSVGGDLVRLELTQHKATEDKTKHFVLMEISKDRTYVAQSGLIGEGLPNHKTEFRLAPGARELKPDSDKLEIRLEAPEANGLKVAKIYTFHRGSYQIDVGYEIVNQRQTPLAAHAYYQLTRDGRVPEASMTNIATFTGPAIYTDEGKFQKVDFADVDKGKAKFVQKAKDGWLAMVQHYFVAGWTPQGNDEREFFIRKVADNLFSAGIIMPVAMVAAGQTSRIGMPLYAGPQEQAKLEKVAPGFDLVVDYGWLTVIASPIYWLLELIHRFVGNWGWSIILLTVLIKALFFPLSAASYRSMAKMKVVTPKLMKIKEQFASDRNRMNQEMMELYRKEKINPLGGCLPIMVQIPVFIALYWVLLGSVEMRHAPWMLWIQDLSAMDPYYVLPIIMGVSMVIQTKLNPTPPDPIQAKVMMAMPIVFTFMFLWFPSGLVLYWITNNVLSIAQQWQITRLIEGGKQKAS
ncbi:MAG: membrane protein insertase YidC [Rhodocyclales bacterium]|jgi:YidC/Oxa1 family membrane protein insertase|nr:membrane protein insertase YidC [Rhodocyclaceae bacterium]PWB43041.1 MAG: membrane protein insertase YidC [Rhodocyclales bacterium]GIK24788.1 MAG: membrane protein insertase YidC [Betaproteobacteria bacterium]